MAASTYGTGTYGGGTYGMAGLLVPLTGVFYHATHDVPEGRAAKVSVYLDGKAGGWAPDSIRSAIYRSDTGALVAVGEEVVIPEGQEESWVDLPFLPEYIGKLIPGGEYEVGVIVRSGGTIRVWVHLGGGSDTPMDIDNPPDPLVGETPGDTPRAYMTTWPDPGLPEEDDEWNASLGFGSSQATLAQGTRWVTTHLGTCGWHGSRLTEPGAFALVNTENPALRELIGTRIRVTYEDRSVYAYVWAEAEIAEDVSLSRRLFQELAVLATEELDVRIEAVEG